MPVKRNSDGVIINAWQLTSQEVLHNRVMCPGCRSKVFEMWPLGWHTHVAFKCTGVKNGSEDQRKAAFKQQYSYLFR